MIILKTLSWSNAFSYGSNNTIVLNSEPITQLIGLNGHGKSSIPLILEEILYNKNSKGILKAGVVNRNLDTNKYNIKLDFSVDAIEYTLSVNRTGNTQKVQLVKDCTDISSHTATDTFKQVENLLGFDFKTFSQVVYQNSSSSLQFLTATDTARKNFLIELLNLERYVKIFEVIKKLHKTTSDSLVSVDAKVKTIKSWISKLSNSDLTIKSEIEIPEVDLSLENHISDKKAVIVTIEQTNRAILNNNQYKKILDSIDRAELTKTYSFTDCSQEYKAIEKLRFEAEQEAKTVKKYSTIKEGTCNSCFQPVDLTTINKIIAASKTKISELKSSYELINAKVKSIEDANKLATAHQQLVSDFEKYSNLIDLSLPQLILDKEALSVEVSELTNSLSNMKKAQASAITYNQSVLVSNAKVETLQTQTEAYLLELASSETELNTIQNQLGLLEALKKAFSTNGLIAYKIENSVKELEELTNEYLAELSDGRFQLEFVLNNDKLNVNIIDNGTAISISALSAGELARVTTSTLLAIRKLMASLSKSRINILFLDETIDNLDSFGKEKLVEVLLQEEGLNTFLISHGYTHPLIAKITVVKDAGISRLET